ncbi:hypothetical protein PsYK624_047050 [Phanerochaete sordida]|uniref:Uncharacterized protein n=1 Tax=Phanerochaete sordida TaxID=48140 RepID=A0A9P3G5T5_9APHY|nr:hypothetical protein PsYK624_047050 [Phanerochaete sordida]
MMISLSNEESIFVGRCQLECTYSAAECLSSLVSRAWKDRPQLFSFIFYGRLALFTELLDQNLNAIRKTALLRPLKGLAAPLEGLQGMRTR